MANKLPNLEILEICYRDINCSSFLGWKGLATILNECTKIKILNIKYENIEIDGKKIVEFLKHSKKFSLMNT